MDLGSCLRAHWLNTHRHSISFAVLRAAISFLAYAFDNSWVSFVVCRRIKRLALRTQVSHVNEAKNAGHDQHHYPDRNARLPAVLVCRSSQSAKQNQRLVRKNLQYGACVAGHTRTWLQEEMA
jgi:hypothetical protein